MVCFCNRFNKRWPVVIILSLLHSEINHRRARMKSKLFYVVLIWQYTVCYLVIYTLSVTHQLMAISRWRSVSWLCHWLSISSHLYPKHPHWIVRNSLSTQCTLGCTPVTYINCHDNILRSSEAEVFTDPFVAQPTVSKHRRQSNGYTGDWWSCVCFWLVILCI